MSRTVNVIDSARKALKQLPQPMVERALKAIYQYARVGDYRVIMEVTPDTITVLRVAHRREVYRN